MAENSALAIWDRDGEPATAAGTVLCWRTYTETDRIRSIPQHLERHAERLRKKYLRFVHDLGEHRVAGKRIVDHLDLGDGVSLWWMTLLAEKSPFKSRRIYDCLRLLALEELLLELTPSAVNLASSDELLAGAIRQLCSNLKLAFTFERARGPQRASLLRRLYESLPSPLKGLVSLRHAAARWPLRRTRNPRWFSGPRSIFLCSYFIHLDPVACAGGTFLSRHWENLPQRLHDRGIRTNWIQLFILSAVVPSTRTGLEWLRRFNHDAVNQGCQAFLEGYLSFKTLSRALKTWLKLNAVSWMLRDIRSAFTVDRSAVWLWPILRDDWLNSLTGPVAIANCLALELFDCVLAAMPHQPVGLYLYENQAWEKALLRAWRKHGHGKIVGVQHATAPFWHLYYFEDARSLNGAMPLPDLLAVNGAAARKAFLETGYPDDKLVAVEALRYLNLLPLAAKHASDRRKHGEGRGTTASPTRVLILGDMIPASTHKFLVLMTKVMKMLPAAYEFTFKPHPGHAVDLRNYVGLKVEETSEPLPRILDRYAAAVAANSTSASLDAFVAGLPVIVDLGGDDLNLSALRGQPGVRFVSTPQDLAAALEAVRTGSDAAAQDRGDFFFLDAALPRWERLLTRLVPNQNDVPTELSV